MKTNRTGAIIFLFLVYTNVLLSQPNGSFAIVKPGINIDNHTKQIRAALSLNKKVYFKNGDYYVNYNQIIVQGNIELVGESSEGVRMHCIGNVEYKSANPSSLFEIKNPASVRFSNITFVGENNVAVAIKVSVNDLSITTHTDIIINNTMAKEIGLIWVSPEKGFTFNRLNEGSNDWGQFGPISVNNWQSAIKIFKNKCFGNKKYVSGNLSNNSIPAITLLYANNVDVSENEIRNYKYGIWVYAGGTRTGDNKQLSTNPILANTISVNRNSVYETFSPIWFSKVRKVIVTDNYCENNQDVAIDFEGCENALASNNIVINSRGGALAVLNGSRNITFEKNKVKMSNFNKQNNIALVRDGNANITYQNNTFEFIDESLAGEERSRVFFKRTSELIPNNSNIKFFNNDFKNVYLDLRGASEVLFETNRFVNSFPADENLILLFENSKINIQNNTINSVLITRTKHIKIVNR